MTWGATEYMSLMPHAQQLLEKAQAGEKLVTKDRRHVVAYIMATAPDTTNTEMASWFGITERVIRQDKKYIREERAASIKDEDVGLVIADICVSFDTQVRRLEKGISKLTEGTRTYLDYVNALFKMQLQKVEALQRLGYYPTSLGNMVVDKFEYKATINVDGSIESRKTDLGKKSRADLDRLEALEAEFTDLPALPAATERKLNDNEDFV